MKLLPGFDPNSGRVTFELECGLLERYFDVFESIVNESSKDLKGVDVEKSGDSSCRILLPADAGKTSSDQRKIGIDATVASSLTSAVNRFINESLSAELKCVEFLPLVDYSWDSMKEDIRTAIKGKRNFCIIKNYGEFLAMESKKVYQFNQKMIYYGTEEYADVAVMVYRKEQEKMKEIYTSQLVYKDWC